MNTSAKNRIMKRLENGKHNNGDFASYQGRPEKH